MKTFSIFSNLCDDTMSHTINEYLIKNCEEMNGRVYRNENGSLISETPCGWGQACWKVQNGNLQFGRRTETSARYKEKMRIVKKDWRSVDDYCRHTFLGYPFNTKTNDGNSMKTVDVPSEGDPRIQIHPNDFPYHLTPDIKHYVLWSSQSLQQSIYDNYVRSEFPDENFDWIMFENLKANKSVKTVTHLQLLVRHKDQSTVSSNTKISVGSKIIIQ